VCHHGQLKFISPLKFVQFYFLLINHISIFSKNLSRLLDRSSSFLRSGFLYSDNNVPVTDYIIPVLGHFRLPITGNRQYSIMVALADWIR
jgi:hypothetical protein